MRKRFRIAILVAGLTAALAATTATAVPTSVPRDPAAPPTGLGRLFGQEGQFSLNCSVGTATPTSASVGISNTYPHLSASYVTSGGIWSAWSTLAPTDTNYDCAGACLHSTSQVRIRGCDNAACANLEEICTATIGVPVNGPPDPVWSGVETLSVGALGCVQTNAAEVVVRLRYAGNHPASGFPMIGGAAATERTAERATEGQAYLRTYTVAPGWTAADEVAGQWSFVVSLDSSGNRDAAVRVEVREHCLNPPQASVVGTGETLAPISAGNSFAGGSELEIATGNPSAVFSLTNHELSHNGASATFGRITPATGATDTAHTWAETATGRDGLAYASPVLALTAQAPVCESNAANVSWWLDDTLDVNLPLGTGWVPGPTVMTDACPGVVSPPSNAGGNRNQSAFQFAGSGSTVTGWPTEVRALAASGAVSELYYWSSSGWDLNSNNWNFWVKRPASLSCGPGERLTSNGCEPCPTYQVCSGGTLATQSYCGAGSPPGDSRLVTHDACIGGVTTSITSCVAASATDPADQPCVTSSCSNPPPEPACAPGESWGWNATTCVWEDAGVAKPCLDGIPHAWDASACAWTAGSSVPEPLCQPGFAHPWNCAADGWGTTTVSTPACYVSGSIGYVYDSWSFNSCQWGASIHAQPSVNPGEVATFNTVTCVWDVENTGTCQPTDPPPTDACSSASFDSNTCQWVVTDHTPEQPAVGVCESAELDMNTCTWDIVDNTEPYPNPVPTGHTVEPDGCGWNVIPPPCPTEPVPGNCQTVVTNGTDSYGCTIYETEAVTSSTPGDPCGPPCPSAPTPGNCETVVTNGTTPTGCTIYEIEAVTSDVPGDPCGPPCPSAPTPGDCETVVTNGTTPTGCTIYETEAVTSDVPGDPCGPPCPSAPTPGACQTVVTNGTTPTGCTIYELETVTSDVPGDPCGPPCPDPPNPGACQTVVTNGTTPTGCTIYELETILGCGCPDPPTVGTCQTVVETGADANDCMTYRVDTLTSSTPGDPCGPPCPSAPVPGACQTVVTNGTTPTGCTIYELETATSSTPGDPCGPPCPSAPVLGACQTVVTNGTTPTGCTIYETEAVTSDVPGDPCGPPCPSAPTPGACQTVVTNGTTPTGCTIYELEAVTSDVPGDPCGPPCPDPPNPGACSTIVENGTTSTGCTIYATQALPCSAAPVAGACETLNQTGTDSCGCPTYTVTTNPCPSAPVAGACETLNQTGTDSCGCPTYTVTTNPCPAAPTTDDPCETVVADGTDACGCTTYTIRDDTPDPPGFACGDVFNEATCSYSEDNPPDAPACDGTLSLDSSSCTWDCEPPPCDPGAAPTVGACESVWLSSDGCSWDVTAIPEPTGCPGEGLAWGSLNANTCSYGAVNVTEPNCDDGEVSDWQSCAWVCVTNPNAVCENTAPTSCTISPTDCNGDGYVDSGVWASGAQHTIDGTVQTVHLSPSWNAADRTWYATCIYLTSLGGGLGLPTASTASHACKICP